LKTTVNLVRVTATCKFVTSNNEVNKQYKGLVIINVSK